MGIALLASSLPIRVYTPPLLTRLIPLTRAAIVSHKEPRLLGLKYFDPARRQLVEAAIIGRQGECERDCRTDL